MKKAGFALDNMGWLILSLITLFILLALFFVFKQPMNDLVQKILDIFTFG